jgi:hypothetical protein
MIMSIFRVYGGGGLGDCWASINYLARLGILRKSRMFVSRYDVIGLDRHKMIQEIIELLNVGDRVIISDSKADKNLPLTIWAGSYLGSRYQWKYGPYRRISYQLDGISVADRKNPPNKDLNRLTNFIGEYEFVRLGRPLSITKSAKIISKSDLFFGVCSGMSHVCHSVGTPCFLIQYKNSVQRWHANKRYILCNGTNDFIARARSFLAKH